MEDYQCLSSKRAYARACARKTACVDVSHNVSSIFAVVGVIPHPCSFAQFLSSFRLADYFLNKHYLVQSIDLSMCSQQMFLAKL